MIRKLSGLVVVLFFLLAIIPSTSAASKSQIVKNALENYLAQVEVNYESEMQNASSVYLPQINSATAKINAAKVKFLSANQVRVLKQGDSRNYWGNFDCPSARPSCIYVDKGPLFQVGEVTTIKSLIADKTEYLDEIDIIINLGLIEVLNLSTYQEASRTIRSETAVLNTLNKQYQGLQTAIQSKREKGLLVESALLAAERASKNASIYDKAFVTALKFEHNRIRLNELASTPWKYINSYKALTSAMNVTRVSDKADAIADRYSYSQAASINSTCGKTFVSETDFRELFQIVAEIYKKATRVALKP